MALSLHNRPVSDRLHPYVRRSIIALGLWLLASILLLFIGRGDAALVVTVAGAFILMVIVLGSALLHIGTRQQRMEGNSEATGAPSFKDWLSGDFQVYQGSVTGKEAMTEILLPLAAVSLGMTAFGIVLHFVAS